MEGDLLCLFDGKANPDSGTKPLSGESGDGWMAVGFVLGFSSFCSGGYPEVILATRKEEADHTRPPKQADRDSCQTERRTTSSFFFCRPMLSAKPKGGVDNRRRSKGEGAGSVMRYPTDGRQK